MPFLKLYDYQIDAVNKMKNGSILCGGVGSGKSRTALAYYFVRQGGDIGSSEYIPLKEPIKDLYIITTARKRDTEEWEHEMVHFLLGDFCNYYKHKVVIDSWNNIKKYRDVKNAFFIFDEQRVVGHGAWVKAFLKIAKSNEWILLSATPGDTWSDYIPVFIANGFFKNRKEFLDNHVIWDHIPGAKFSRIAGYLGQGKLNRYRNQILVTMNFERKTIRHNEEIYVGFDLLEYKKIIRTRQNPQTGEPFKTPSEYCNTLRKLVNSDESRQTALLNILESHPRAIIFYNFDYELDILRNLNYGQKVKIAEWSGHKHEPIPKSEKWVYLVQYTAGAEGWNCVSTDTIIFFSQNYSYKVMAQAAGRIDRLNTPYEHLWYYHLKSRSGIDLTIARALKEKKKFNEAAFAA